MSDLGDREAPPILSFLLDLGLPNRVFWALAAFMLVAVLTTLVPRREKAY